MGRQITLMARLNVIPMGDPESEVEDEAHGKQLVFTDPDNGEVILYSMGKELTAETARLLKMSNKSLIAHLHEKNKEARAAAMLRGAPVMDGAG